MKSTSHRANWIVSIVAIAVLLNGLFLVVTTLVEQFIKQRHHLDLVDVQLSALIGLTLIYLSNLLWRKKQNAWIVTLVVYGFYMGLSVDLRIHALLAGRLSVLGLARLYIVPIIVIIGLLLARNNYKVRSDVRSFGVSLRITIIVLLVALLYGIVGFELMDTSDFHQRPSFGSALHDTVDQLGLTTSRQLKPHTRKARVFLDSLNLISIGAVTYTALSFFQPIRARFSDQTGKRRRTAQLLNDNSSSSEDFFKLWPHDKGYFFNQSKTAGVAFRVHRGIALVVGDPFGDDSKFKKLLNEFDDFCKVNDWIPSFIHVEPRFIKLYQEQGYTIQKIGEEAIVDNDHFLEHVAGNKYFRNISNRFEKAGYHSELLKPPHDASLIDELKQISDQWLKLPGRTERGFVMGYFTNSYLRFCDLMILRDGDNKIQAFMNQIPSYDPTTASYDLIRHMSDGMSNSTDFLLMNFIKYAKEQGFRRVNLGLSPLVGLDKSNKDFSVIDRTLQFVYSNSDRFYSFSGLYRYKAKYEPAWSDRYITYRGGIRGFSRTISALGACMRPRNRLRTYPTNQAVDQPLEPEDQS